MNRLISLIRAYIDKFLRESQTAILLDVLKDIEPLIKEENFIELKKQLYAIYGIKQKRFSYRKNKRGNYEIIDNNMTDIESRLILLTFLDEEEAKDYVAYRNDEKPRYIVKDLTITDLEITEKIAKGETKDIADRICLLLNREVAAEYVRSIP